MAAMWCAFLLLALYLDTSRGHGSLNEPPGRASAWRHGFDTKPDYDDDGCNCGGFGHQWNNNGGKCGICGDTWEQPEPRRHELGGEYGSGVIVRSYKSGAVIPITVNLTTCHKGFWQLRLCTDPGNNTEDCFVHLLQQTTGETEFRPNGSRVYELKYTLPTGVSCEHCVLAWWYTAGNNWGQCLDGTSAVGCGMQENFRACADITVQPIQTKMNKFFGYPTYNNVNPKKDLSETKSPADLSQFHGNSITYPVETLKDKTGSDKGDLDELVYLIDGREGEQDLSLDANV